MMIDDVKDDDDVRDDVKNYDDDSDLLVTCGVPALA